MAKNITIREGDTSKQFTAKKLKTNLVGGGTANWVPEDEAVDYVEIKPHEFTQNGTFNPSDFNADGFGQVKVNVPQQAGTLIQKNITENGTYDPADDEADGYSLVTVNVSGGGGGGGAEWVDFTQSAQATITPTTEVTSAAQVVKCEYLYDKDRYVFYFRIYIDYGTDSGLNYNISFNVPSMQGLDGLVGVDAQFATMYSGGSIAVANGVVTFTTTEVIQHCYCLDMSLNVIVYTNKEFVWIYGRNPRRITKIGYEPACMCAVGRLSNANIVLDEIIVQNSNDFSMYDDLSQYDCIGGVLYMIHGDKMLCYIVTKAAAADIKNQSDLKRRMYIDGWETGGIEEIPLQNVNERSVPYTGNEFFWDYCFAKLGGTPAPSADTATLNNLSATIDNRFMLTQNSGDKAELYGRWFQRSESSRTVFSVLTFTNSYYYSYCIFTKENVAPSGTSNDQWGALVYAGVMTTPSGNTVYVWRMNGCWDTATPTIFTINGTDIQTPTNNRTLPYIMSNDSAKTCTLEGSDETKIGIAGAIIDLALFSE